MSPSSSTTVLDRSISVLGGALGALLLRELFAYWKNKKRRESSFSSEAISFPPTTASAATGVAEVYSSFIGSEHPFARLTDKYKDCVYMDYNATTPVWPEVTAAMEPFTSTCFGNPSSPHVFAAPCKSAITLARSHVSRLINAPCVSNIIFTSCGSEADNRAIDIALSSFLRHYPRGLAENSECPVPHVVTSAIEHPAILEYLVYLRDVEKKIEVTILPVDAEGFVSPSDVSSALQYNTALVTIMHSNNEVGTIQPIKQIGEVVASYNASLRMTSGAGHDVMFHSDGAQSLGKVLIDVQGEHIDLLTIVGHKFGAPKGVAAIYVREGIPVTPLLHGGGQEGGRRAGTENVLLMAGIGEASRIAYEESAALMLHMLRLKLLFIKTLRLAVSGSKHEENLVHFNGPARAYNEEEILKSIAALESGGSSGSDSVRCHHMLPNTISVGFDGVLAAELISLLKTKVACSAGTTCHACHEENSLSAVLAALKVPKSHGLGTLRISFGRHTTVANITDTVKHVVAAVTCVRNRA